MYNMYIDTKNKTKYYAVYTTFYLEYQLVIITITY